MQLLDVHLLVKVDVLLHKVDDELGDGVRVVEGVQHGVREVSPAQDSAPGTVLGQLGPGLHLVDGLPAGNVSGLDVGGSLKPGDLPIEVIRSGQFPHDVSVRSADGRGPGHVFCKYSI